MNITDPVELEIIGRLHGDRENEKIWAELHFYRTERAMREIIRVEWNVPANLTSPAPS